MFAMMEYLLKKMQMIIITYDISEELGKQDMTSYPEKIKIAV